jgi:hypothetical protein
MGRIIKVDHVAYACAKGMIEKWAWFHTEVEGGTLVARFDDVDPENPDSSMKLWCIDYEGEFGIALIEGIDRNEKSQVTLFSERHGDHSIQHVAYDTDDLEKFIERLKQYDCEVLGEAISRRDSFGLLKQVFCKGYSQLNPSETAFAEYVQRPRSTSDELEISFSQKAGKGFFRQIQEATAKGETVLFTNFSAMPTDWQVPELQAPTPGRYSADNTSTEESSISR